MKSWVSLHTLIEQRKKAYGFLPDTKVENKNQMKKAMLKKGIKAVLVDAKEITFAGKEGTIAKWKYTFLTPEDKAFVGYGDKGLLRKYVRDVECYTESAAFVFYAIGRMWNDELKWAVDETIEPKKA